VPAGLSDIEKLIELERRFNIRSTVYVAPSMQETFDIFYASVGKLSIQCANAPPNDLKEIAEHLKNAKEHYLKSLMQMEGKTTEERSQKRYIYLQRGTGKIMAYCGDKMYSIISCEGKICRDDEQMFSSFAEMGAKTIIASYRGKLIAV
jgi:hypothetical protein